MTTTAAEAYTAEQLARQAGVDLLDQYLARLAEIGYRKAAIDTWADPAGHTVQHSYTNREWTLRCGFTGKGMIEVRYSTRATMPSVEELISATVPIPF